MSLYSKTCQKCTLRVPHPEPDGLGGFTVRWQDGREFTVCLLPLTDREADRAEQDTADSRVRVLCQRSEIPSYHDVFRTGDRTYRVTSRWVRRAPPGSAMDLAECEAREWREP